MRALVSAALLLLLAGCATVIRGTIEQVQFDSDPAGATMRSIIAYECGGPCPMRDQSMGGADTYKDEGIRTPEVPGPACITPCAAQVPRNQELIVTFTKDGYEPQTLKLSNHVAGGGVAGVAGNVIIGGAIGAVVDVGTGAAMDHHPNPLKAILVPIRRTAPSGAPAPKRQKTSGN